VQILDELLATGSRVVQRFAHPGRLATGGDVPC
jgi:hypothetical protein